MKSKLSAEGKALNYLGYRMRTEKQLRQKLSEDGYDSKEIDEAIDNMVECGYIDDYRFCREYFAAAAAKGRGIRRIQFELAGKGISSATISQAIDDMRAEAENEGEADIFDEKARALEIAINMADRQLEDGKDLDDKFMARVGRRLAGQGYSADTAYYVLGKLRSGNRKNQDG